MIEPYSNKPKITANDISFGSIKRYFLKHVSLKKIMEVDKRQYDIFKTNSLYMNVELEWTISGLANDVISKNGNIVYGTKHKNQVITEWYETKMPGIRRILNNPLEYFNGINN